jgi:hypothetical protein
MQELFPHNIIFKVLYFIFYMCTTKNLNVEK